ncbi:MAG: hypothetical protein AAGB26_07450 [Planctomycetota bacterium]
MAGIKDVSNALRSAEAQRKKLRDRRESIKAKQKLLEKQGIKRGSLHQQEKRPGYKVWYFNMASIACEDGQRVRVYVGNDPKRLKFIKECIARMRKHDELGRELAAVEDAIHDFGRMLRAAIESAEYLSRRW